MKKLLRHYIVDTTALFVVSRLADGLIFEKGIQTFLLTGLALTGMTIFAKPVINILLLPLNLITFNLFRWISSAIALYIVQLLIDGFSVVGFFFQGFSTQWIDIPALNFHGVLAYIAYAFVLSVITTIVYWIVG